MVKGMLGEKALMDFERGLMAFCEVGKKNISDTNAAAEVDNAAVVYDLDTSLTDNNLADCLKAVTSRVFPI